MGLKSAHQRAGLRNVNSTKKILYLVHPGYEAWMKSPLVTAAIKRNSATSVIKMDCATIKDIQEFLREQKTEEKNGYDSVE